MEMTFKLVDGMLVAEIDPQRAEEMGAAEGTLLEVVRTDNGISLLPADVAAQQRAAATVLERHGEALRMLADR